VFDPIDLSTLPDELELPMVAGSPPLVPMVAFAPVIGKPRSLAAVDAGRQEGLMAWLVRPEPDADELLRIGVICQVGESVTDDEGRPRTPLHAVARCTWSDIVEDGDHARVTVRPIDVAPAVDPELEPLAVGMIVHALVSDGDDLGTLLATATKDLGGLADEVLFMLMLSHKVDETLLALYRELDGRARFMALVGLLGIEPVELPNPPATVALRERARAMLAGDGAPDLGVLMDGFFAEVAGEDGMVSPDMVLVLGRVIATTTI